MDNGDKEKIQGKSKEAMGSAREKTGEMIGNEEMQAKGAGQKTEGKSQNAIGKMKDKASELLHRH